MSSLSNFFQNSNNNLNERINAFSKYERTVNYRFVSNSNRAKSIINVDGKEKEVISFVSNDYLGFSQHPKVIEAGIDALRKYGAGSGASPLIGGQLDIHEQLERKIADFFEKDSAIIYTSGYASNAGMIPTILGKQDLAIIDIQTHASVFDGCVFTNKKVFPHNDIEALEMSLKTNRDKYRDVIVIVDGVYSQDGDIAPLYQIYALTKKYNAYLIVDDAHGVGIFGERGRGILEKYNLLKEKEIIVTGTFSKTLGSVGGYVVGNEKLIKYLKYFSRENIFSAAATPAASASALRAISLIDEEPKWRKKILDNIAYFKKGLDNMKIDYGQTQSAIFPIMIRNENKCSQIAQKLMKKGIYANPITAPAVKDRDSRLRMSILATHEKTDLDKTLVELDNVLKELTVERKVN